MTRGEPNRGRSIGVLQGMSRAARWWSPLLVALAMAGPGDQLISARAATAETSGTVTMLATAPPGGVIPWADLPAPPYHPAKPLPGKPLSRTARPCRAAQLEVGNLGSSGETEDLGSILRFTNISPSSCLLYGTPRATEYGPGFKPMPVSEYFRPGTSFDMPPGQSTMLWFRAHADCLSEPAYAHASTVTRITIRLPSGDLVTVAGLTMPRTCGGIVESDFFRQTPETRYAPEPLQGSREAVRLPASVRAGAVLTYLVAIHNPTRHPLSMKPCPGFDQGVSVGTRTGAKLQGLNCDGHTSLPAHATLLFQMQLAVPADAPTGRASVYWDLTSGDFAQSAGAAIDVIGNDTPCHAAQLAAAAATASVPFAGTGLYGSKDSGTELTVVVTNTSPTPCTLQGAPTVAAVGKDGRSVAFRFGNSTDGVDPPPAQSRLAPGGQATTVLAWHAKWCAADPNPMTITLGLPSDGEPLTVQPGQGWTPPPCRGWDFRYNVSSSDFG